MAQVFNVTANVNDGTTTSPVYTAKQADNGVQGVITAGPMPDPTTTVSCLVEVSQDGGNTWVNVGGLSGTGGLTGPRGGPYDQPVTISASTYAALQKGWQVRAQVTVTNAPAGGLPVSFVGNTF